MQTYTALFKCSITNLRREDDVHNSFWKSCLPLPAFCNFGTKVRKIKWRNAKSQPQCDKLLHKLPATFYVSSPTSEFSASFHLFSFFFGMAANSRVEYSNNSCQGCSESAHIHIHMDIFIYITLWSLHWCCQYEHEVAPMTAESERNVMELWQSVNKLMLQLITSV